MGYPSIPFGMSSCQINNKLTKTARKNVDSSGPIIPVFSNEKADGKSSLINNQGERDLGSSSQFPQKNAGDQRKNKTETSQNDQRDETDLNQKEEFPEFGRIRKRRHSRSLSKQCPLGNMCSCFFRG